MRYPLPLLMTAALLAGYFSPRTARPDEGMWLFNDLPREILKERYDFEPTDQWAKHIQLASVRFSSGGSASFVSSDGLVLTNHHVAADTLHKLSTPEENYYEEGFLATAKEEELKAPDLELNQLIAIEDVTEQVHAAVTEDMEAAEANKARQAAMAQIEQQSLAATGLRSDVITLYGGAKYHLYRYKKYTDVRLVWAPESSVAFFGGDVDNFEYPRYCLDVTLFRVYENGKPAQVEHFLEWSENGAAEGELVFVSGNPGRTDRGYTTAALEFLRDHSLPYFLDYLCRMEVALQQYCLRSPEKRRRGSDELFGIQNRRKAVIGMLHGLQAPLFVQHKEAEEQKLLTAIRADPGLQHFADAWQAVADAQLQKEQMLKGNVDFLERYFEIARDLVLMAGEDEKPSGERFQEFRDSGRESLEHELFSPAPIYDDLEIVRLAAHLEMFAAERGGDDPLVESVLAGKNPPTRAAELISASHLNDVEFRRKLAQGGVAAIEASDDPLIQLFRTLEPEYRRRRKALEELDEVQRQAYAKIDQARVAIEGTSGYPDATFTLRLAFGVVKGYEEAGETIPPWTTMGGAFEHETAHEAQQPWLLPEKWHEARDRIDGDTPLNFVSTVDIIGGNSGSPVINRAGEFVGIIFDGNIQSLTGDYMYEDEVARATSVHSSAIREALQKIYGAPDLASHLGK